MTRKIKRGRKKGMRVEEVEILTNQQRADLSRFLNGKNANEAFNSKEEIWVGMKINDGFMVQAQPGAINLINRNTGDVIKTYKSIEDATGENGVANKVDAVITAGVITIDEDRKVLMFGDEIREEFVGVWTDGNKVIMIDMDEELLLFNEYDHDGDLITEECYEIAEINSFINNNGIEELDQSCDDDYSIYKAVAEGLALEADQLLAIYSKKTKKSDTLRIMKTTARLVLDAMNADLKYIDINHLLSEVYSYDGYMVGGFLTENGPCVYILRAGKPTKLVRVECGDITMESKLDGNLITHFFNAIEDELDKIS